MFKRTQLGAMFEKYKQKNGNSYPTSQPQQMTQAPAAFNAGMQHPMNVNVHPGMPHMGSITPTQMPKMPAVPHAEQPNLIQNANKFSRVKKLAKFK